MSFIFDISSDKEIYIPCPKEKIRYYLNKVKIKDVKKLTTLKRKMFFITVIKDFLKGAVSLDEMSEIAHFLWSNLPEDRSDELSGILLQCSELNFYLRNITDLSPFCDNIKKVFNFYKNNIVIAV